MPISRSQQPRQMYGLGSFVKSIGKGIKSFVKSDLGKIALLGGGLGLAGIGPFKGLAGSKLGTMLFGSGLPLGPNAAGTNTGLFGKIGSFFGGEKTLGKTLGVMAGGTVLGGVLGALSPEEQEEISSGRNISALRSKLTTAYQNLGYDESEIPALVENDLSEYTSGAGGYAEGGRIGYAMGTDQIVDQASGIMGLPTNINKAGVKELDLRETGGFIPPVGVKEKADDIPAMLSNNEFVFTADAVKGMGDGDVNKGAQRMYDMMKKLEKGGTV